MPPEAPRVERFDVLGVPVSALTMATALGTLDAWIRARTRQYVCVTGVHGIMESQRDDELRRIHAGAGLVTTDGMPLVWLAHLRGLRHVERVYGPDLMLACCDAFRRTGRRHYFYGGGPGVAARLASRLRARFPGLEIVGCATPPFRPLSAEEDEQVLSAINAARPDIVWVGLSTPKQERWMASHVGRLTAPVLVGVGAAFDFHAGLKRQAPRWMQRHGLEWLFRLTSEPRRLAPRYLVNNPSFVWRLLIDALRRRPTLDVAADVELAARAQRTPR